MLNKYAPRVLKLLIFYFVIFGLVGIIGVFDFTHGQSAGDKRFFVPSDLITLVMGFVVAPVFGLYSLLKSFTDFSTFDTQWEVHLVILLFFGLAIIGFLRENRLILAIAALMPPIWAIMSFDWQTTL